MKSQGTRRRALLPIASAQRLNDQIVRCRACPRLVAHCQQIGNEKRKAYSEQTYWARPIPNLGYAPGGLLIVGLAPGAHGANRTGRMFTGDRSGQWLFRALHRAGFCNQPSWESAGDGLELKDCAITAVCHCAPPDNRPSAEEVENCRGFLIETLAQARPRVLLCLGNLAWTSTLQIAREQKWLLGPRPKFGHGQTVRCSGGQWLLGSYHPSQQNTFTGRLTEAMLDEVLETARNLLRRS